MVWFPGAGNTTLINRILTADHRRNMAVIIDDSGLVDMLQFSPKTDSCQRGRYRPNAVPRRAGFKLGAEKIGFDQLVSSRRLEHGNNTSDQSDPD